MNVGAVVLAAGAGSRFGGAKLRAVLDGRPMVRHVIDAAVAAGLEPIVVVVPPGDALDGVDLAPARSVTNPMPAEGLSSSVRLGLRALEGEAVEAAVIMPGDQPRVRVAVIAALIAAAEQRPGTPFMVPQYRDDAAPNPILARRSTWRLADELAGDRGFGPVLDAHPELVGRVPVDGANPDVDTVADLLRLQGVS
ncbi:MAG TPA: nucleotidyltransferase family protein [Candidatus Limnocylindrales bacterium]